MSLIIELEFEIAALLLDVRDDLLTIGRIADHEILLLAESIDQNVITTTTMFIADQRVAALPVTHSMDLTGADAVETPTRILSVESESPHVGDIEETAAVAGLVMLLEDRSIADGEFPTGIVDHLTAEAIVKLGEWSPCGP